MNCFVIAVFFVSAVPFSVMAMAGDNSANTVANGYSESKSSLTVNVHNLYVHNSTGTIVERLRLPGKGKITVMLYKGGFSDEQQIAIRSHNFETNALYAPVTFTDLTPSEGEGDTFYYYIKVFQEPDAKGKVTESWGAKEKIFLKEGHNTIKFVRHTAWISAVTINGKSPYGDDIVIDINKDKKAHFKVTVKNDDYD